MRPRGDVRRRRGRDASALILIVEDNPRNLKLVRDVLEYAGYRRVRPATPRTGSRLRGRSDARPHPDGRPAARDGRLRGARAAARRPRDAGHPGRRAHGLRHEGRPGAVPRGRASTATSRSRSACASFPARSPQLPSRDAPEPRVTRRRRASCVVDDLPQNMRLLEAVLAPRGFAVRHGGVGRRRRSSGSRRAAPTSSCSTSSCRAWTATRCAGACAADPATQLPAGRHGHGERRARRRCGHRGGRRRLHHQAVRPGRAAGAGPLAAADQAVPRHASRRRRRSSPSGTASSSSGSPSRSTSSSGSAGCGGSCRRRSPSWSSTSGDESFLREPPPRDHRRCSATCAASPPFAETGEPEDVMAVLARVPRGARGARVRLRGHARALRRRRADGVLQRPGAVPGRTRAGRADGGGDARPRRRPRRAGGAGRGTTSASGSASRRATPRWAGSASRAAGTTRRSARVTNLAARLCAEAAAGQILVSPAGQAGPEERRDCRRGGGPGAARLLAAGARPTRSSALDAGAGVAMSRRSPRRTPRLSELDEDERAARSSTRCRRGCRGVWSAMRLNQPGESVVVVPSMTPRTASGGRRREPGARGALPVPPAAAAPAAAADGLRDLAADHPTASSSTTSRCCRASSRATPGARLHLVAVDDCSPRAARPRSCSSAPGCSQRIRALIPDRVALATSCPYTTHDARARPGAAARHPHVRRRPAAASRSARRPAAGGSSPRPASRTRSASRTCTRRRRGRRRSPSCARRGRACGAAMVKLNEGVSGRGQRARRPRRPAGARRRATSARQLRRRGRGDGARARRDARIDATTSRSSPSAAASSRSGSSAPSCAARACSCG